MCSCLALVSNSRKLGLTDKHSFQFELFKTSENKMAGFLGLSPNDPNYTIIIIMWVLIGIFLAASVLICIFIWYLKKKKEEKTGKDGDKLDFNKLKYKKPEALSASEATMGSNEAGTVGFKPQGIDIAKLPTQASISVMEKTNLAS
ncbi:hypothetical protein HDE_14216 [Halotydeus destructor]|nr:hypothetical protein HDE_14216 [Halotydeus destructor]